MIHRTCCKWTKPETLNPACCRPGIFGLGVADGVYMWKTKGIDSGLFSRTLMATAREGVASGTDDVVRCEPAVSS